MMPRAVGILDDRICGTSMRRKRHGSRGTLASGTRTS
jgi:hypothetical protein